MYFLKQFASDLLTIWSSLLGFLPGNAGLLLRRYFYKNKFKSCGSDLYIYHSVDIKGFENISIGNNFIVHHRSYLYSYRGTLTIGDNVAVAYNTSLLSADNGFISIGNDVIIAQNVVLRSLNHTFTDPTVPIRYQGHEGGFISIEDDDWIGANSVILPNVTIGAHSIVGAGSVVTKDIPPYSVFAGVPAKLIKSRL